MSLLFAIEFLVVFAHSEQLSLELQHLLLVDFEKLHVSHLLLVADGFLGLVEFLAEAREARLRSHQGLVDAQLDVDPRLLLGK